MSDLPELVLQTVLSCSVGSGGPLEEQAVLLMIESSFQLIEIIVQILKMFF